MLARLQQAITLSLIVAALLWVAGFLLTGHPLIALLGAVMLLFGHAVFLGLEFILLALTRGNDPAPVASRRQLLTAWWNEVLTAPQVFCWRQPFRSQAEPDAIGPASRGRTGVVFVHGFVCNRGFWNPWMRRLRADGVPFIAVSLEPVFGGIDEYIGTIEAAVHRLQQATGRAPSVVAHSMGGLAVRAWLVLTDPSRVDRVVTIGTPHRGTWLGRFAMSMNARQMHIGQDWLTRLEASERRQRGERPYEQFTCFFSHCDNIVFPPSTATLPDADNRHIDGTAHVQLAFEPRVMATTARLIATPRRAAPVAAEAAAVQ